MCRGDGVTEALKMSIFLKITFSLWPNTQFLHFSVDLSSATYVTSPAAIAFSL